MMIKTPISLALLATLSLSTATQAAELYVYPSQGQTAEDQQRDRYECHVWAADQTGFDPTRDAALPVTPKKETKSSTGRSLVGGAALGAAVGAIAGKNVGEAAAIGAGAGLVGSKLRGRRSQKKAQEAYQADLAFQQSYTASKTADYDRAMKTCLTGRGYTVS